MAQRCPARVDMNKAVMGATHIHTPHCSLHPTPPHTLRTIRPELMELSRPSKQTPEWGWMYNLLLSAPTGVLLCLNTPTPSQATQAIAELLCL